MENLIGRTTSSTVLNSIPMTLRAVDLISRNALASGFKPQTVASALRLILSAGNALNQQTA